MQGPSGAGKGANESVTINSESIMQQAVSDHLQYEDAVSFQMDPRRIINGITELGDATACLMSFSLIFPDLELDGKNGTPKQSSFVSDYR